MNLKRILCMLLALTLAMGLAVMPCFALDVSALHSYTQPEGYHLFTELPTQANPVTDAKLYLGGAFAQGEDMVFHVMNSSFSSGSATTTTDAAKQYTMTVHYGGVDETYGTYYYLVFTLPDGTAYAFAYAGGYFTQNKIQSNGLPSGGWAAKHRLFYHDDEHFFYHRPSADMTVMKTLKISATSFKFFTDTVANVLKDNTYPVRLYALCSYNDVPGYDAQYHWTGSCTCGAKDGLAEHDTVTDWNLKEAAGHGKVCSCGYVLEAVTAHNTGDSWTEIPDSDIAYAVCTDCGYQVFNEHTHVFADTYQYDAQYHWQACVCGEKNESTAHSFGLWQVVSAPSGTEKGSDKRTCKVCDYFETRESTLRAEDFEPLAAAPKAGTAYFWGVTQLDGAGQPTYFFSGEKLTSNFNTKLDMMSSTAVYADAVSGGYRLYFLNASSQKQYICMGKNAANAYKTYVGIETDAEKATVYTWNSKYNTFVANVVKNANGEILEMVLGAYTSGSTVTTKLSPMTLASLAEEHYFPSHLYAGNYEPNPHDHTYGPWVTVSLPTHLNDQGRDERVCSYCGGVDVRYTTLEAEDFVAIANPPATNVPFYLGATQLQIEGEPTYFFKGAWAPSKYQNMDSTTDIQSAKPMYVEAVNGGLKIYFDDNGVKTYLVLDKMTVSESESVFVQPVTDETKATKFLWNSKYGTFQTHVDGKGDYYIGLYTTEDKEGNVTKYTKLQALLVSGLGRQDRHPAKVYMQSFEAQGHTHSFSSWKNQSYATNLTNQGLQERTCACGYVQARTAVADPSDYMKATAVPGVGVGFYFGATQRQVEGEPTYFFKGSWAPKKYQNMDVSTNMRNAQLMYAQAEEEGFKLYFVDEGVRTYLKVAYMTVGGSEGVFVQPVTNFYQASVFSWNEEYCTFQTHVEDKGDYYIGNYTNKETNYTKLCPLLVSGLGREDRHPAAIYVSRHVRSMPAATGDDTPVAALAVIAVLSLAAVVSLAAKRRKFI